MARRMVGLLARLASFLNPLAAAGPVVGARRRSSPDRRQLAIQLLGTLSPEVLAETGHRKLRLRRPAKREPLVAPCPPPVGDLSRPRFRNPAPGPLA